ncbi:conserved exported hypothetical protein [uncultured Alphaproteobacteria bacterium]|uniref:Nickel transport protein n=1 Tax=uncultured Alphaproteobacteria bacterium TaxID=91750 RepID=A0A212K4H7_9PROT|nr:conserved exported hypothetical protein [uncultured Alphaproteobacteria bacterium]
MIRRILVVCLLAFALFGGASEALAHKMKVFASADGAEISGYAYFGGGNRAVGVRVVATADGAQAFAGTTDAEGRFAFRAARRADHLIVVDSGDGHLAQTVVPAADLPEAAQGASVPVAADVEALVEHAVARQIRPLREQLDAYEEKVRWHDVLGGLGVIFGVAGLSYGLAMHRRAR